MCGIKQFDYPDLFIGRDTSRSFTFHILFAALCHSLWPENMEILMNLFVIFQNVTQQSGAGVGFNVHRTKDYHSQCSIVFGNHQTTHKHRDQSIELQRSTVENTGQTGSGTKVQHQRCHCQLNGYAIAT